MSRERLTVGDLDFEVRRSVRRRTRELTVDRGGELVIHTPESVTIDELHRWVETKLLWVHQKLLAKEVVTGTKSRLEALTGETIAYLGRNYRLKMVEELDGPFRFDGQWFYLRRQDENDAQAHLQRWYEESGTHWIAKRIRGWQPKVSVTPAGVAVGDLGFRWGSCGRNSILRFNWRLFQLPVRLVDYVIVHEMVHLQVPLHTAEFWRVLDRVLPDWRERKTELGGRSAEIWWRKREDVDSSPQKERG
jgi:predicted metal-dependent hydrolase